MHQPPIDTGYRDLRKGRISLPNHTYLLTTVCEHRRPRFANADCAAAGAEALREQRLWRDSTLLCWVLMPDHLHVLLTLGESESLAHMMNRIKSVTSRAARSADSVEHPVWMPGFHDRALRRSVDLRVVVRYVLANPIRSGLVESVDEYPYWGCVWGSEALAL